MLDAQGFPTLVSNMQHNSRPLELGTQRDAYRPPLLAPRGEL